MRPGTAHGKSFLDVKGKLGVNTTAKPLTQMEVNGVMGVGTFSTASVSNTDVLWWRRSENSRAPAREGAMYTRTSRSGGVQLVKMVDVDQFRSRRTPHVCLCLI